MAVDRSDPPLAAPEAETLRAYLDYHRDTLLMKADGLTQEQLNQAHAPSTLTLGALLKHLALVEEWWFCQVLEGREAEPDWVPDGAFDDDPDWEMTSSAQDTPEELHRIFDHSRAAADAAIDRGLAAGGLDATSVMPSRREEGQYFSLRWIVLHMIEEYARHNGHADLLREAVDGQVGE